MVVSNAGRARDEQRKEDHGQGKTKRRYCLPQELQAERNGPLALHPHGQENQVGVSGYGASQGFELVESLDIEKESIEAAELAIRNLHADWCQAGEMPVIIHNGFGGVIFHEACGHSLEATSVAKGNSEFSGKLGEQIASTKVTAIDDGTELNSWGTLNMDDEGLATQQFPVIENGILKNYSCSRLDAVRLGTKALGTCYTILGDTLGFPFAGTMKPGTFSKKEMISETKNGLLVTNFHYINFVNPPVGSITGMTKDGLFNIKNGKIVGSAKNMRFTDEIPRILKEIEVGKELKQPIKFAYDVKSIVAPIKVRNFRFTSKT